jgi:hypothetical protein
MDSILIAFHDATKNDENTYIDDFDIPNIITKYDSPIPCGNNEYHYGLRGKGLVYALQKYGYAKMLCIRGYAEKYGIDVHDYVENVLKCYKNNVVYVGRDFEKIQNYEENGFRYMVEMKVAKYVIYGSRERNVLETCENHHKLLVEYRKFMHDKMLCCIMNIMEFSMQTYATQMMDFYFADEYLVRMLVGFVKN